MLLVPSDLDTSPGGGGAPVQICPPGSVSACWWCDHLRRVAVAEENPAVRIKRHNCRTPYRLQPVSRFFFVFFFSFFACVFLFFRFGTADFASFFLGLQPEMLCFAGGAGASHLSPAVIFIQYGSDCNGVRQFEEVTAVTTAQ